MRWGLALALLLLLVWPPALAAPTGVTVVAVGDLMLAFGKPPRPLFPFETIVPLLRQADVRIANLECPVSDRGTPTDAKSADAIKAGREFVFRADPAVIPAIKAAGFQAVTVANNHSMDYTSTAFLDGLDRLHGAGLLTAGGGHDIHEARRPAVIETHGTKIAVLGYSDVIPAGYGADAGHAGIADAPLASILSTPAGQLGIEHDIAAAHKQADIVICFFHWGVECTYQPTAYQRLLAHRCIDAGADAVVGCHPHVLQGVESYRGHFIAYSMGNFAFYGAHDACCRTGMFFMRFGRERQAWFVPTQIVGNQPVYPPPAVAASICDEMQRNSAGLGTRFAWHTERGVKQMHILLQ